MRYLIFLLLFTTISAFSQEKPVLKYKFEKEQKLLFSNAKSKDSLLIENLYAWDVYPFLPYFFFDKNSSDIPERYRLSSNSEDLRFFTDTSIIGGTLDKYYRIYDILGFRMRKYPAAKIELVGKIDGGSEKDSLLGINRAERVKKYLTKIWSIDDDRININWKIAHSCPKDIDKEKYLEMQRRVEIISDDWNIIKPILESSASIYPYFEIIKFDVDLKIEEKNINNMTIEVKYKDDAIIKIKRFNTNEFEWDYFEYGDIKRNLSEIQNFDCQLIVNSKDGNESRSEILRIPVKHIFTSNKNYISPDILTRNYFKFLIYDIGKTEAIEKELELLKSYLETLTTKETEFWVNAYTSDSYKDLNSILQEREKNISNFLLYNKITNESNLREEEYFVDHYIYSNATPEGRFFNETVHIYFTPIIR